MVGALNLSLGSIASEKRMPYNPHYMAYAVSAAAILPIAVQAPRMQIIGIIWQFWIIPGERV